MTTTIHATGPLYVGPPYASASFDEIVTVLHVLVVGVFLLSLVVACAAMAVAVFSVHPGCGPDRATKAVPLALVVSFVTGASLAAWAAGPGMGLLTLGTASGLVVAVGWYIAWRERRWWADYSAAQSAAGVEGRL
jgi:hypothetical protein